MLVGSRMTYPVITVGPRTTINGAAEILERESIHSLPVVDRQGRLLGLITVDEINAAKKNQTQDADSEGYVEDVMIHDVLSVTENTPIEEAARIITDYEIKSLPVLRGNFVVGIITSTSLIRILLELTGARTEGTRITFLIEDVPGNFIKIFTRIYEMNGNIETFSTYNSGEKGLTLLTLKVSGVDKYAIKQAIDPLVSKILDIR